MVTHSLNRADNVSHRVRVHHGRTITHETLILLIHEILRLVLASLLILLIRRLIKPDSDSHRRVRTIKQATLVARVANVRTRRETTTVKHAHTILSFTIHQRTTTRRTRAARELRQPLAASRPVLVHADRRFQAGPRVHKQFTLLAHTIPEAALRAPAVGAGRRRARHASGSNVTDITAHTQRARPHAAHRPRQPRQRGALGRATPRERRQQHVIQALAAKPNDKPDNNEEHHRRPPAQLAQHVQQRASKQQVNDQQEASAQLESKHLHQEPPPLAQSPPTRTTPQPKQEEQRQQAHDHDETQTKHDARPSQQHGRSQRHRRDHERREYGTKASQHVAARPHLPVR